MEADGPRAEALPRTGLTAVELRLHDPVVEQEIELLAVVVLPDVGKDLVVAGRHLRQCDLDPVAPAAAADHPGPGWIGGGPQGHLLVLEDLAAEHEVRGRFPLPGMAVEGDGRAIEVDRAMEPGGSRFDGPRVRTERQRPDGTQKGARPAGSSGGSVRGHAERPCVDEVRMFFKGGVRTGPAGPRPPGSPSSAVNGCVDRRESRAVAFGDGCPNRIAGPQPDLPP